MGYWLWAMGERYGSAALPLFEPLPYYPLIRYSSCVVSCVDDATTGKLGLLDEMNHACIILVGVNADIGALCRTPMEYEREDTSLLPIRGNAMDGAVEAAVVQPLTVLDIRIGRVFANDKDKGGAGLTIMLNDITHASSNIAHELFASGILITPLRRIAVSNHLRTSVGKNSH